MVPVILVPITKLLGDDKKKLYQFSLGKDKRTGIIITGEVGDLRVVFLDFSFINGHNKRVPFVN